MLLLIAAPVRNVFAQVPAGDLPGHPIPHVRHQIGVLEDEVSHDVIPGPSDVLDVAFGVAGKVLRPHVLWGMALGDVLALEGGQGRRLKDVLRVAVDGDHPLRVSVKL